MMSTLHERQLRLQGQALALYHFLLARTVRWRIDGKANLSLARASKRPLLWAFWHEQISIFVTYGHRFIGGDQFALVTLGGDPRGDILSAFAKALGADPYAVDMQGNPMAAGRSVLHIIQAMKAGKQSLLAPDGPDGPAFQPKAGVAYLARKAEAAVIPVGGFTNGGYHLKRWDRYLVPFPFARLRLVFGKPILVNKKASDEDVLAQITNALNVVYNAART